MSTKEDLVKELVESVKDEDLVRLQRVLWNKGFCPLCFKKREECKCEKKS